MHMSICICVVGESDMCVQIHVCTFMWRSEDNFGVVPYIPFFLETGFPIGPELHYIG